MRFRPMTAADLEWVLPAEARLHAAPWTLGNFADSLEAGHGMWLALEDETPVGYAVTSQVLDEAHLLTISILPEYQRGGRGAALLAHLLETARARGAARMFLEVRAGNRAAQALYARSGFREIGRRKGYYPAAAGREDAIVMARDW